MIHKVDPVSYLFLGPLRIISLLGMYYEFGVTTMIITGIILYLSLFLNDSNKFQFWFILIIDFIFLCVAQFGILNVFYGLLGCLILLIAAIKYWSNFEMWFFSENGNKNSSSEQNKNIHTMKHPADVVTESIIKIKNLIFNSPLHVTLGYILLVPPFISVWLFFLEAYFPQYANTNFLFGSSSFVWMGRNYSGYSFTPYTPIFVGLMALAGSYLIKSTDESKK